MIGGTGAIQGSIRWWCRNHRLHHRYTDTPVDPYNARQGFLYSHIGWMLFTKDYNKVGTRQFDIADLESDPIVMWQNKYYGPLAFFIAFVLPPCIAGFGWGDWIGGYFFASILRIVIVHHSTFCVNSLAHWLGDQPFAADQTPRDHFVTAILTFGEGYHNFHHEFPYDYRNAIKWYQYDPTKWTISVWKKLGLAWDLREFGRNEIQMGVWQQKVKKLEEEKAKHEWPPSDETLPRMDWYEFQGRVHNAEKLIVIDKYVLRINDWMPEHPGGEPILAKYIGKDATSAFNGGEHNHSAVARGIAAMKRVAVIDRLPDQAASKQKAH